MNKTDHTPVLMELMFYRGETASMHKNSNKQDDFRVMGNTEHRVVGDNPDSRGLLRGGDI